MMNTLLTLVTTLAILTVPASILYVMVVGFIDWAPSLRRQRLKKKIREWMPIALKKGPTSGEWRQVEEWSLYLRDLE